MRPIFLQELSAVLRDAADQLQATAYTTGTGQPKGVITALAGTASEINGGGTEALISANPYTIQNALPPRFQARAQWCANLGIINTLAVSSLVYLAPVRAGFVVVVYVDHD
ncbi:MAG: hypothetical protein ACRDSZ_03795 [Pseudonocardiaceae bacterium]